MDKAIVLHADILGFKKIIWKADSEDDDTTLNKLKGTMEQAIGTIMQFQKLGIKLPVRYKLFSDNVYVSFPFEEESSQSLSDALLACIAFARTYTNVMMDNNFYIRGGIAIGKDYSDETTIFSVALVKAYELEKAAFYPRILIDSELIDFAQSGKMETPGEAFFKILNNSFIQDEKEGLYFLNPTDLSEEVENEAAGFKGKELNRAFIRRYLGYIKGNIDSVAADDPERDNIISKYEWLRKILTWIYHDMNKQMGSRLNLKPLRFTKTPKDEI